MPSVVTTSSRKDGNDSVPGGPPRLGPRDPPVESDWRTRDLCEQLRFTGSARSTIEDGIVTIDIGRLLEAAMEQVCPDRETLSPGQLVAHQTWREWKDTEDECAEYEAIKAEDPEGFAGFEEERARREAGFRKQIRSALLGEVEEEG